jgi:hypothetical protein
MPDITTILIGILILVILWVGIKFIFKLTAKIFSCGCALILIIGAILFFTGNLNIF